MKRGITCLVGTGLAIGLATLIGTANAEVEQAGRGCNDIYKELSSSLNLTPEQLDLLKAMQTEKRSGVAACCAEVPKAMEPAQASEKKGAKSFRDFRPRHKRW